MRCSKCGTEAIPGKKFCAECGRPLSNRCSNCGSDNTPGAKFCADCGNALGKGIGWVNANPRSSVAQAPSTVRIAPEQPDASLPEGERKTVTALFADIKGSMEMMEDLDPEEARAIVDPALALMIDAAHRYGGYIVQSTGDGIFALFGAPVAHEDHPQRALYAALRMQEELRRYSDRMRVQGKLPLQARVGINTGEVVVRSIQTEGAHAEYTPIGHSTGLASRMQTLAPVGSIAVTDTTRKLCEGYFTFKPLGPTEVKGVSEPVVVHEVTGLGPLRTRLQVAARRGLTKFVGRQHELEQMKHALELAAGGRGQIVAAMGEPGVGKSRLFHEFKAVVQSNCLVLEAYSVSHGKASAYLPVIDLLKVYFEIVPEDDERKRREKVAGKIVMLDRTLEDTLPYLFGLLGIVEGEDTSAQLDPQLRRRRTLEAFKRILVRESLNQPLIVELEDLHWIDSETQALLNLLVDGIATARILLLVNYRPEYHHQWSNKTYYTQIRLDPLGHESADEMLTALLADSAELEPLKRLIMERSEHNPFFVEEMVQAMFEQGVLVRNGALKLVKPLDELRLPPTVQAMLASRIDRLPAAEKELLQSLAVLGREFPMALVKRVTGQSEEELEPMLSDLQAGEFIYEQPAVADIEYIFKHALTQEVVYHSVLAQRRRRMHEAAAHAIETLYAQCSDDYLPELAHHYDRSGNVSKAIEYLGRAGGRAARQNAHSAAIAHFSRAIGLLKELPDSVERARQELDLQTARASSLVMAKGPGAQEREPALARAQALCQQLGDNGRLMEVLLDLSVFQTYRRAHQSALDLAARVLALAQAAKAESSIAAAHLQSGVALCFMGSFSAAREHLERVPGFISSGAFHASGSELLPDVLFMLGYPEAALQKSSDFISAARLTSDPFSLCDALDTDARLQMQLRHSHAVLGRVREMLSIAVEYEQPYQIAMATFLRGAALAADGRLEEGIPVIQRAIAEIKAGGTAGNAWMLATLAEACGHAGRPQAGLDAISEGLASVQQTNEKIYEAELHRVKGALLLLCDPADDAQAEQCFRTSIAVSRRQRARSLELRTTMSLARLLAGHGRRDEARAMLAEIYGWFTEGFDTADLRDARTLLAHLSQ